MLTLWLQFIFCASVIVISGTFLSRYGDVIAEKVGLGRTWIGLILMASVTSLPELFNNISAVTIVEAPDIALGDIMGSCIFNLSIIALMDILHGPSPIFSRAEHGHILSAGFGVILIGIASLSILYPQNIPVIRHIGLYTPLIIFTYFIGVRSVFFFEKRKISKFVGEMAEAVQYSHISTKEAVAKYALNALIIIGAATWLPFIADRLAIETGLGRSFVGTVFVGMTTSLPEIVVSIAALRIGATDMAIANLFGSNMFNILVLAIADILYVKGSLMEDISPTHAITGLTALLMTGIAVVALTYRIERKAFLRLSWDTIALLLSYIVNIYLLYSLRGKG